MDPGKLPELQWRSKHGLKVDPAYQRTMESYRSKKLVDKIGANFQWRKFGVLVITKDGFIIDGQHRHGGAMQRETIDHLPCLVHDISVSEAADIFVGMNKDRVNTSPLQAFKAELAAEHEEALFIKKAMDEAGVVMIFKVVKIIDLKRGETHAIATIRRQVLGHRERAVRSMQLCIEAGVHLTTWALRASFLGLMGGVEEELVVRDLKVNGIRVSDSEMFQAACKNVEIYAQPIRETRYGIRDNLIIETLEQAGHTITLLDDESRSRDERRVKLDGTLVSYTTALIKANEYRKKSFLPGI